MIGFMKRLPHKKESRNAMLTTKKLYSRVQLMITAILLLLLQACREPAMPEQNQSASSLGEDTYISVMRGAEIEKKAIDEAYIKEVRLILVNPVDKAIIFNETLDFPDSEVDAKPEGYSNVSVPKKVKAGAYSLYCIANESSHAGVTAKLAALKNEAEIAELTSDFDTSFKPDKNSGKGLLMTASKKVILEAGKNYLNPNRIPIDLICCVARLDLTFERKEGSPAEKLGLYISKITMGKMPSHCYLFPHVTKLYAGELTLIHDYKKELQGNPQAIPFGKEISRYVSEYNDRAKPLKLEITIRQVNTAFERTKTITLNYPDIEHPDKIEDQGKFTRNHLHKYNFTLSDWSNIEVKFEVGDWTADNSWVYVGQYFNLLVSDKTMPAGKEVALTLYTSRPTVPFGHKVTLKPLNGSKINGAGKPVSFEEKAYGAFANYTLEPGSGSPALEVIYGETSELTLPLPQS